MFLFIFFFTASCCFPPSSWNISKHWIKSWTEFFAPLKIMNILLMISPYMYSARNNPKNQNFLRAQPVKQPHIAEFCRKTFKKDTLLLLWNCGSLVPDGGKTPVVSTMRQQIFSAVISTNLLWVSITPSMHNYRTKWTRTS